MAKPRRTRNYPHLRRQATARAERQERAMGNTEVELVSTGETVDYAETIRQLRAERDAAEQRADTYRRRTLALLRATRFWRSLSRLWRQNDATGNSLQQLTLERAEHMKARADAATAEVERLRALLREIRETGTGLNAWATGMAVSRDERHWIERANEMTGLFRLIDAALAAPGGEKGA